MQNNPPEPCIPHSQCWCEQRPNNPHCQGFSVPINDYIPLLMLVAIFFGMYKTFKLR